jgi:hypothetical protein
MDEEEHIMTEEELAEELFGVYNNCEYTPPTKEDREA